MGHKVVGFLFGVKPMAGRDLADWGQVGLYQVDDGGSGDGDYLGDNGIVLVGDFGQAHVHLAEDFYCELGLGLTVNERYADTE